LVVDQVYFGLLTLHGFHLSYLLLVLALIY